MCTLYINQYTVNNSGSTTRDSSYRTRWSIHTEESNITVALSITDKGDRSDQVSHTAKAKLCEPWRAKMALELSTFLPFEFG
jgi:hypothetical protein